jgi:hypothetical protein
MENFYPKSGARRNVFLVPPSLNAESFRATRGAVEESRHDSFKETQRDLSTSLEMTITESAAGSARFPARNPAAASD